MRNQLLNIKAAQAEAAEDVNRVFEFVASDASRDSDGQVCNPDGWDLERFNKNGVIGYQHDIYGGAFTKNDPDNVIGKGTARVEDGRLIVRVELEPEEINKRAEKIRQKLEFGSLNAVSVGFVEKGQGHWGLGAESAHGENPTYYFAGQELLEVSIVNIPANPNAVRLALQKAYDEATAPEAPAEEPVEAPAEEPAEAPAEEPVEVPVEEPAEAPAEEPVEAPVEEPETKEINERARKILTDSIILTARGNLA